MPATRRTTGRAGRQRARTYAARVPCLQRRCVKRARALARPRLASSHPRSLRPSPPHLEAPHRRASEQRVLKVVIVVDERRHRTTRSSAACTRVQLMKTLCGSSIQMDRGDRLMPVASHPRVGSLARLAAHNPNPRLTNCCIRTLCRGAETTSAALRCPPRCAARATVQYENFEYCTPPPC